MKELAKNSLVLAKGQPTVVLQVVTLARSSSRPFLYLAVPTLFWVFLRSVDLIPLDFAYLGDSLLAPVLFILAIPVSIFIQLDKLSDIIGTKFSNQAVLIFCLVIVYLNFVLWSLLKRALLKIKNKIMGVG